MRAVLQRVTEASVRVPEDGEQVVVGQIGVGLVVLLCVMDGDTEADLDYLVQKIVKLRLFEGDNGKFDHSLLDIGGGVLLISQFTLAAHTRKGRRPDFTSAAGPEQAQALCELAAVKLAEAGVSPVAQGRFGARMQVALVNEGPVTISLDSRDR